MSTAPLIPAAPSTSTVDRGSQRTSDRRNSAVRTRSTPLAARGEPMVWVTGLAMVVCIGMILVLLTMTVWEGTRTFWPRPIETVVLRSGEKFLGIAIRDEVFDPNDQARAELEALRSTKSEFALPSFAPDARPIQRLYRVGNKELTGQAFRWVPLYQIRSLERDPRAVLLEREEWGVWLGIPESITSVAGDDADPSTNEAAPGEVLAGVEDFQQQFGRLHAEARELRDERRRLETSEIASINSRLERARLRLRQTEIDHGRSNVEDRTPLSLSVWLLACVCTIGCVGGALWLQRAASTPIGSARARFRAGVTASLWICAAAISLLLVLERPWVARRVSDEQLAAARERYRQDVSDATLLADRVRDRINEISARDAQTRITVREVSTDRFAPQSKGEPNEPLRLSQVVRSVQANALDLSGKLGVYLSRWREFVLGVPREANTEGGILPVIFGTVMLTLLLSVLVVPLGVVAALYMREYARQGIVISAVRVAVNNLAGVPSVVYGVFGLGFFCYGVGQYIDVGPASAMPRWAWWSGMAAVLAAAVGATMMLAVSRPATGERLSVRGRALAAAGVAMWIVCGIGALALVAGTPYFNGLFEAGSPSPTFGKPSLIWAALTLALLTLPVVIVATEEAISAVPRSMREGSYGCGATQWQTIRRIVLPRAMPGIMTGMILAMARGAGEVAPLMLVGAVKLAPQLPVSAEFPFIHLDRSFMHLGFHIYDVGFQSPDSEAARPTVWTTAFVLITIVLLLNVTAIRVRSRLRRKFQGGAF